MTKEQYNGTLHDATPPALQSASCGRVCGHVGHAGRAKDKHMLLLRTNVTIRRRVREQPASAPSTAPSTASAALSATGTTSADSAATVTFSRAVLVDRGSRRCGCSLRVPRADRVRISGRRHGFLAARQRRIPLVPEYR